MTLHRIAAEADLAIAAAAAAAPPGSCLDAQLGHSDTLPAWLLAVFDRHDQIWAAGPGMACEHVDVNRPDDRVRCAAAWRPGVIVCRDCLPALEPRTGLDEGCCDACLTQVGDQMWPTVNRVVHPSLGVVLMFACLCRPCTDGHRAAVGLTP